MSVRREDPLGEVKKEMERMLETAEDAVMQGISDISGYKDVDEFKKAVIEMLSDHSGFDAALRDLHAKHPETPNPLDPPANVKDNRPNLNRRINPE